MRRALLFFDSSLIIHIDWLAMLKQTDKPINIYTTTLSIWHHRSTVHHTFLFSRVMSSVHYVRNSPFGYITFIAQAQEVIVNISYLKT